MRLLLGYMIFSSAALLGMLGGVMFQTFIQSYGVVIDYLTFYFLVVNFAAVGTIAIFYAKGIPTYVTQMYLILTSVILSWQLSFFNDWTAWTLLVLLALYDLCAVLTPCGPLKALVKLMQKDDAPAMPGLLYEARLPDGVERPGRATRSMNAGNNANGSGNANGNGNANANANANANGNGNANGNANASSTSTGENQRRSRSNAGGNANNSNSAPAASTQGQTANRLDGHVESSGVTSTATRTSTTASPPLAPPPGSTTLDRAALADFVPGVLPFSIAKIYKLHISEDSCPQFVRDKYRPRGDPSSRPEYTSSELLTEVNVLYPRTGGRIVLQPPRDADASAPRWRRRDGSNLPRYIVLDRIGSVKRILVMDEDGKVFEEVSGDGEGRGVEESSEPNSIKLGLGDFIFYSVLVAKAALNSFTTFAACMLVILAGLGGTLVLLAVYHAALPALPISIFLGVIFFFTTKALIEPWIEDILTVPFYV